MAISTLGGRSKGCEFWSGGNAVGDGTYIVDFYQDAASFKARVRCPLITGPGAVLSTLKNATLYWAITDLADPNPFDGDATAADFLLDADDTYTTTIDDSNAGSVLELDTGLLIVGGSNPQKRIWLYVIFDDIAP